jgi:arsenate reductase (thioredoxin)
MPKILFVCYGNVGRSQMAEAYYNKFTGTQDAISAGVSERTPTKYGHPTDDIVTLMKEEGFDVSKKAVKTVNKTMFAHVEHVIVLCDKEQCPEFISDSRKVEYWDIKDPYHMPLDEARTIRNQIRERVKALIGK